MGDEAKLCTIIYEPKDTKEKHPILMQRTTYSIAPYGNTATDTDYIESTIKIYHDKQYPSNVILPVISFPQSKQITK